MDPKWRNVIVIAIVVIVVIAGVGLYLTRSTSSSSGTSCSTPLKSTNPITVDQPEIPYHLDPDTTFSTPGWAAVQQVYQGLVNYNGSSYTSFSGVLAKNWTSSYNPATNFTSYTFTLRSGVQFSNGDPYNAYVQWFSFYRSLLMDQGPQFILEENFYSTNFTPSNPLSYYSNLTFDQAANTTLANDLNTWNFLNPNASEIAQMELPNQSFQVINNHTIQLNLGYGYLASNYTYLLASISAPNSYAVDPAVVQAQGGVQFGQQNTYLNSHAIGTGPYLLSNWDPITGGGYTLTPWSGYWGKAAAAQEPWNNNIQPANTTVDVVFSASTQNVISDLQTGVAASASFAYSGPSDIAQIQGNPCLNVNILPTVYGATSGSWWVFMNQSVFPFNNLSVRAAIVHAINYTQIIQYAFGGYGSQWVGPVPPSYPYYNPANLAPYPYNLTLAKQEIQNSPCANNACASLTFNYEYQSPGKDWADSASILQTDLAAIGITIKPVPLTLAQLYTEQTLNSNGVCTTATNLNGGPFYIGQEFYTSDYISPDDWTQNNAYSFGSANMCMSGYANATVDALVFQAAAESNPANLTSDYTALTAAMYYNYTDAWLIVPDSVAVSSIYLHGIIQNPMASAEPYAFYFNTQWAS